MAEPLAIVGAVGSVIQVVSFATSLFGAANEAFAAPLNWVRYYGPSGVFLAVFGSRTIWTTQAELLASLNDDDALAFRKTIQDESNLTAVAVRLSGK